jgi:CSLREA domain-containing protein
VRRVRPVLLAGMLVAVCATHAAGISFTVDSTEDTADAAAGNGTCADALGRCTLRAAVQEANASAGPDVIMLPAGVFRLTLVNPAFGDDQAATGDLDVNDSVTIAGAGAPVTIVDGNGSDRVFDVFAPTVLVGLTVRNGHSGADGGGIETFDVLTLTDVAVSGNTADGNGGGIENVNAAILTRVTVDGNVAAGAGGGVDNGDGATITAVNATVSGNTASRGGGIENSDSTTQASSLTNVTIASNSGGNFDKNGNASFVNTIVASPATGGNCTGAASNTSQGHNLDSANTCNFGMASDLTNVANPLLGGLADNGGSTRTHALLAGSAAIDAGDDGSCPSTDQRGHARPFDGDGNGTPVCDLGAFERDDVATTTTIPGQSTTTTIPGAPTTTTTTLAPAVEICGNCVDDDGDGKTDVEDAECCPAPAAMRLTRVRLLAGKGGPSRGRLALRAVLADSGFGDVDPTRENVTIELHNANGELLCAMVASGHWTAKRRTYRFRDPDGTSAEGLTRASIRVRANGAVELRAASPRLDLTRYDQAALEVIVGVGGRCSAGLAALRRKGSRGWVLP